MIIYCFPLKNSRAGHGAIFTHDPVTDKTLSETKYDRRKIEPVTMNTNFIHF